MTGAGGDATSAAGEIEMRWSLKSKILHLFQWQSGVTVLNKHKNWRASQLKCCSEDFLFSEYAAFCGCFRKCLQRGSTVRLEICKAELLGQIGENWGEDKGPLRCSDSAPSVSSAGGSGLKGNIGLHVVSPYSLKSNALLLSLLLLSNIKNWRCILYRTEPKDSSFCDNSIQV